MSLEHEKKNYQNEINSSHNFRLTVVVVEEEEQEKENY